MPKTPAATAIHIHRIGSNAAHAPTKLTSPAATAPAAVPPNVTPPSVPAGTRSKVVISRASRRNACPHSLDTVAAAATVKAAATPTASEAMQPRVACTSCGYPRVG